jgi:hypothetical protein
LRCVLTKQGIDRIMLKRRAEVNRIDGIPGELINLNRYNKDFLDEEKLSIPVFVDHDLLHEMLAYGPKPIQDLIRPDPTKALCSPRMFFIELTPEQRLQCVKEEGLIIAMERKILPRFEKHHQKAYFYSIKRICTSLTRGWFRTFAVDNWPVVWKLDRDLMPLVKKIREDYEKNMIGL